MAKRNKAETAQLIKECKNTILDNNMAWKAFIQHVKDTYGLGRDRGHQIWRQCWQEIDKTIDKGNLIKMVNIINKLDELTNDKDRLIQLKAIQELNKMGGLYSTEKHEVVHKTEIDLKWGS